MIYVQTLSKDVSCTLKADEFEVKDEWIYVTNKGELVGMFDVGNVAFIYKTEAGRKEVKT